MEACEGSHGRAVEVVKAPHRKGSVAENDVAKRLAQWWRPIEPDARFKRTPKSGGWATAAIRGDFKASGDVMTTAKRWPFTVEVKRREGWSMHTLTQGRASPVWQWWRQCCREADEESRIPMLWLRKNRQPWLIMLPNDLIRPICAPDIDWPGGLKVEGCPIRMTALIEQRFLMIDPRHFLKDPE